MLSDGKEINFKNLRHSKYVNFTSLKPFLRVWILASGQKSCFDSRTTLLTEMFKNVY